MPNTKPLQKVNKLKTIDQLVGAPAGTFSKFIESRNKAIQQAEEERRERIQLLRALKLE